MVVSTKLSFAHFAMRNFQSVTSRLDKHLSVDNDGSNTGDDFEVVIAPPEIGWPRQGFETGTAQFLEQQRQVTNDSGSTTENCKG